MFYDPGLYVVSNSWFSFPLNERPAVVPWLVSAHLYVVLHVHALELFILVREKG
jgi:hypothetical protein